MRGFAALLAGPLLGLLSAGCASGSYGHERLLDLSDVFDIGYGRGQGLAALVQASAYFEVGLGIATLDYQREWYGRRSAEDDRGLIVGAIFLTGTGNYVHGRPPLSSVDILGFNILAPTGPDQPPPIDRFRVGVRIYLPFVTGGLFLNVGEVFDLFAGVAGFDPAGDEGVAKSAALDEAYRTPVDRPPLPTDEVDRSMPPPASPPTSDGD